MPAKTRRLPLTLALLLALGLGGAVLWQLSHAAGGGGKSSGNKAGRVLSVIIADANTRSVPRAVSALGHVLPIHSVAVRPQVTGVITRVGFQNGADVKKEQVLFQLDPRPFKAAVDAAAAALKKDQAALAYARWKVKHLAPQIQAGAASADTLRSAKRDASQLDADVAADHANLEKARLDLAYTTIRAPLAARAGAAALKVGNLVQAGAAAPLVVLNQLAPIEVTFHISQNDLPVVQRFRQAKGPLTVQVRPLGAGGMLASTIAPSVGQPATDTPMETGTLTFIDNTVAADSGTVALRARFANEGHALWPGAYVSVQLVLNVEKDALVVPSSAIQQGQKGSFVYVVADGKARLRNVKVTREQGTQAVIASGLKAGDKVVVQVLRTLRDGIAVRIGGATDANAPGSGANKKRGAHRATTASSAPASP